VHTKAAENCQQHNNNIIIIINGGNLAAENKSEAQNFDTGVYNFTKKSCKESCDKAKLLHIIIMTII
jgi:hypothetical protein